MIIKKWFVDKMFTTVQEKMAMGTSSKMEVTKETEKAYQVTFSTDFGKIIKWVPKSATFVLEIGDKVKSRAFGEGVVLEISGATSKVDFNGNIKSMLSGMLELV